MIGKIRHNHPILRRMSGSISKWRHCLPSDPAVCWHTRGDARPALLKVDTILGPLDIEIDVPAGRGFESGHAPLLPAIRRDT